MEQNVKNVKLGVLLIIAAQAAFAVLSGFVKAASDAGLPAQEIVFFQSAVSMALLLPWILRPGREVLVPKNKLLIAARSFCGAIFLYLFYMSIRLVPLVNAVLLQNTAPLFIPVLTLILFRKKPAMPVLAAMLTGFIGVALVLDPGRGFLRPGDLIALSAGGISALGTILLGRLEDKGESGRTLMLYYLAIIMLAAGAWSMHAWKTPQGVLWSHLVFAGVFYTAYMSLLMLSLRHASPVVIAPFIYLGVVFSGVVDWAVWKQYPDLMTILGSGVVILAAVLSAIKKGAEK